MQGTAPVDRNTISAGFGDRFVAWLIDFAVLLIPNIIVYVVFKGAAGQLISLIINAGYVIYFWSSSGQTPGKSVMKLKVVHAELTKSPVDRSRIKRELTKATSVVHAIRFH